MESRKFIVEAAIATKAIKDLELCVSIGTRDYMSERQERESIQNNLNQLFGGLQNPTLPSAYKLRDLALEHNYQIDPRVQQRIAQFDR